MPALWAFLISTVSSVCYAPGPRERTGYRAPALFIPSFILEQSVSLQPEAALTSDLRPLISDFRPLTSDFCPYDVEAAGS
jgi:hypothetical protein